MQPIRHPHKKRRQLNGTRFVSSVVGILRLITLLLFLIASIVFLSSPEICHNTPPWYPVLFPILTACSAALLALLYAVFALGLVKRSPDIWMKADIALSVLMAGSVLTISILTISVCGYPKYNVQRVPGPMGIAGSILLVSSAAWLFIVWGSPQEEETPPTPPIRPAHRLAMEVRKDSVHV